MSPSFFESNRYAISTKLKGGLAVISAYGRVQSSNDMAAIFRQEANFWYLTGIDEPDSYVIIDGKQGKSWLVLPVLDDVHRTFDGGITVDEASQISGIQNIISADEAVLVLRGLSREHDLVHTVKTPPHAEYFNFSLNPTPSKLNQLLERTFKRVQDCRRELASLRAIKQDDEIKSMRKAIGLTTKAFSLVKSKIDSYSHEYAIEADFSYQFRMAGSDGHAYDPIVARDRNACTLHYVKNNSRITKKSLVLIDIGASMNGYAADITRTYAVGVPTKRQSQVHSAVRDAHHRIIDLIEPLLPLDQYQSSVDEIMIEALKSLDLYENGESLRRYFPHAVSHGLGIDVHDSLGNPKRFEENMVLTVEPGIYIPEESIGVRIEDDILVTAKGQENLSRSLSTEL